MARLLIDTANIEEIIKARQTGHLSGVTTNPTLVAKEVNKLKQQGQNTNLKTLYEQILQEAYAASPEALVSFEVISTTYEEMIEEARRIHKAYPQALIKIPICPSENPLQDLNTFDGLHAIHTLSQESIRTNCTLIHTVSQGILATTAGATLISPFVGRLNDHIRDELLTTRPEHAQHYEDYQKTDYYPAEGHQINNQPFITHYGTSVSGVDLVRTLVRQIHQLNQPTKVLAASIRNQREAAECNQIAATHYITLEPTLYQHCIKHEPEKILRTIQPTNDNTTTNSLQKYPHNWQELEQKLSKNPGRIQTWLYHPKTIEGMKKFTEDAESIKEEYQALFK